MNEPVDFKPRRTFGMWLVAIIFAIAALLGGLRVYGAIDMQEDLQAASASFNIPYLVISGGLTCLGGLVGVGSVFLRRMWVPKTVLISAAVLSVLYWFDQFCFVENTTYISIAWGFSLALNVILLGLVAWALTRKRAQTYYKKKEIE